MGAILIGKTTHQPLIPVDDISAYYVDYNGNLNLEMKDVRCEATETTLTLTDRNGDSWVIEKYRGFYRISDYARFCKYDYTCGLFDGCWSFKSNKEVRCI